LFFFTLIIKDAMFAFELEPLYCDDGTHFFTSILAFMYPNQMVTKFGFDKSIHFLCRLLKACGTKFTHHLPFIEPP
jgi:hypothetical protein